MSRHRMSSVDTSWLHMDRETNRLIVTSVMWFDEQLDWDVVRTLVRERLIDVYPRFSQCVVDLTTSVWWEDVEDFDLERHVRQARLAAPGGPRELHAFVSSLVGRRLPRTRPLWEMHLVDGYRGEGCAIVSRIHHCIADGVALSRVLMSLTDDPVAAAASAAREVGAEPHTGWVGRALGDLLDDVRHPSHAIGQLQHAGAEATSLARLLALSNDAHTSMRGDVGTAKTVVWEESLPLAQARAAAHALDATVNDVVLCAISGSLRNYLARNDGRAPDIRAILPVNLRPADAPLPAELGNMFGLAFLDLPLSIDDPSARLVEVVRRTRAFKHSAEALVSYHVLGLTGHAPYAGQQAAVDLFTAKASAVITNVAGSPHPVFLAGRKVRGTIGWPPESGNLGLGVAIISYDGELIIGLMSDDRLIHEPARILTDIRAGVLELLEIASAGASSVTP